MMEAKPFAQISQTRPKVKHYDMTTLLTCAAPPTAISVALCLASTSSGTVSGEFALMTVFP